MERENPSVAETLKALVRDFGSLAVAFMTLGRIRLDKKNKEQDSTFYDPEVDDMPDRNRENRRVLHPSMVKKQPGDFFFGD